MLVLLIIFMLMTMLMGRGQEVKIPPAHNISSEPDKLQPIVSIDEKGTLFVEKTKLGQINDTTLREMGAHITKVWEKKPRGAGRIYIKAHQDVTYGQVYPVLSYLNKDLSLQAIDLAVTEKKD
jgi:biopolymer transport protein TolR